MRVAPISLVLSMAIVAGCTDRQSEPVGSSSGASATSATTKAAPPSAPKTPDVPALLPGETPPSRGPNYFEPHEMGSTGIATAYQGCLSSVAQSGADMPPLKAVPYCSCIVDAWRSNFHASSDPDTAPRPTKDQVKRCEDLDGSVGPYALPFPKDTANLYNSWSACVEKFPELDHGVYCGCYTDGMFENPKFLTLAPADDKRCLVADQYYEATKKHLTVRQFQALVGRTLGDVPEKGRSLVPTH